MRLSVFVIRSSAQMRNQLMRMVDLRNTLRVIYPAQTWGCLRNKSLFRSRHRFECRGSRELPVPFSHLYGWLYRPSTLPSHRRESPGWGTGAETRGTTTAV